MTLRNTYTTLKTRMINNLIMKGVEADVSDGLTTLANKISDINVLGELTDISVQVEKGDLNLAQLKIYLLRNNKIIEQQIASAANSWTCIFTDVPINCTVECDMSNQYTKAITGSVANGFVCTLTKPLGSLTIEKEFVVESVKPEEEDYYTNVQVSIVWNDDNNADLNRPSSCNVHLYSGGDEIDNAIITSANNWSHTFSNLLRYVNGHLINYSITCDPITLYRIVINGYTITNTYQPERTSKTVKIIWDDNNNAANVRPSSVRMSLTGNNNSYGKVILNEANNWTATISNLPTTVNSQPVTYTWTPQELLGYEVNNTETAGTVTTFTMVIWQRPEVPL